MLISIATQQLIGQLCTFIGLLLAGCVCWQSHSVWQRRQRLQDLSVLVLAGSYLIYLLVMLTVKQLSVQHAVEATPDFAFEVYVGNVGFQLLAVAIGYFLLLTAATAQRWVYLLLTIQAVFGLMVLTLAFRLGSSFATLALFNTYVLWVVPNLCSAAITTAVVLRAAWRSRSTSGWLAFNSCLMGFALYANHLLVGDKSIRTDLVSQLAFAVVLWVVWRITSVGNVNGVHPSTLSAEFQQSANIGLLSDFGPLPATTAAAEEAVTRERRRIGQDLHDGVASQLVTLLSTLNTALPNDQRMALALEKCLVDLKMTVDTLDASSNNVLDALGCLRYRVQHSLDKLGICMSWRVEVRDELAAVRGDAAMHILRIAQESLSNVMVHARASSVEVVCRYEAESDMLLLEIRDNGRGFVQKSQGVLRPASVAGSANAQCLGKGLGNMRSRAKSAGGELTISSKLGTGTRVRLRLPINSTA